MRGILHTLLALFLLNITIANQAYAGARDGATYLSPENLYQGKQKGKKVICGKMSGAWLPGTVGNNLFLTRYQQIVNLQQVASKQKGVKKRSTTAAIRTLRSTTRREEKFCNAYTGGGGGNNGGGSNSALKFRPMTSALGLALKGGNSSDENLFMVTSAGTLESVLESGRAQISRVLIAPNDKIYVLFVTRINLETGNADYTNGCILAEVSAEGGSPTCVDHEVFQVNWPQWGWNEFRNRPIQFDDQGAIYYWGWNSNGTAVLRRYLNGVTESLITDNVYVADFLVRPNGEIFIGGTTTSTQTSWVRHLGVDRSLRTIHNTAPRFLSIFSDNNLYYGVTSNNLYGIKRFMTDTATSDPKPWTSMWYSGWSTTPEPYYNTQSLSFCSQYNGLAQGYCTYSGAMVNSIQRTTSGKTFAVSTYNESRALMQYYPSIDYIQSAVTTPTLLKSLLNHLFVAGTDINLKSRLMMFDTDDNSEVDLLQDNQIEIYRMGVVGQSLIFDGLNFANNQYVVGAINLQTLELNFSSTGGSRLVDFEMFAQ